MVEMMDLLASVNVFDESGTLSRKCQQSDRREEQRATYPNTGFEGGIRVLHIVNSQTDDKNCLE